MKPRSEDRSLRTEVAQSAGQVFRIPMLLGIATVVGLLSALFGDGVWDALSWVAILAPVVAVALAWKRRA